MLWTDCEGSAGYGWVPETPPDWWPGRISVSAIEEMLGMSLPEYIRILYGLFPFPHTVPIP